jgi:putative acetyltransferase
MELIINSTALLNELISINEEWISNYFELEDADYALAANPYQIIENGGYTFSLVAEGEILGVCALFNEGNGVFELARMAVSPKHQGKGFGKKLIVACFAKLSEIRANKVYLLSNIKLKPAISLYKKYGFKTVSQGQHSRYSRANIVMEYHV